MSEDLSQAYAATATPSLYIGGIALQGKLLKDAPVHLVLKSLNRHGLIAGATGSGKTKTMQVLAEQLSLVGVPSLVMDIKGDVSGLAMAGEAHDFLTKRCESLGIPALFRGFPVEFFTLNPDFPGVPLRASLTGFGPLLISRMMDLNETQTGVLTVLFEYAKDSKIPLKDLKDLKALLQYVQTDEGKKDVENRFGAVAASSGSILLRKIVELQSQGGEAFFGEPAFAVNDFLRKNSAGEGIISILRLMDMQENPKIFSSFMLKLLTDVYKTLPEVGDPEKPRFVLFIDEAHLIFNQAGKALLNLLETMVRLIRSKGVGLVFCTQTPNDIPDAVLSQLGFKIQHALRAFTAKDRQAMKLVAQNFPPSAYYHTEQLLTSLGIGEALLTALDEKGQPGALAHVVLRPPQSRMGVVSDSEINKQMASSALLPKYQTRLQTESAAGKLNHQAKVPELKPRSADKKEESVLAGLSKNTLFRQLVRQSFRQLLNTALKWLKTGK